MNEKLYWTHRVGVRGWWHAESRARTRNAKSWKKARDISLRITISNVHFDREILGTWTPEKPPNFAGLILERIKAEEEEKKATEELRYWKTRPGKISHDGRFRLAWTTEIHRAEMNLVAARTSLRRSIEAIADYGFEKEENHD